MESSRKVACRWVAISWLEPSEPPACKGSSSAERTLLVLPGLASYHLAAWASVAAHSSRALALVGATANRSLSELTVMLAPPRLREIEPLGSRLELAPFSVLRRLA